MGRGGGWWFELEAYASFFLYDMLFFFGDAGMIRYG